ncbi:coiled-coil domain-containing protein 6-like [Limulus polyphemus]|uniref:Coiled-coil domain-containing protein 6-like n=1 Tax=Limulus polyphemus TaxID=6850 RepID=A0ABM1BI67_LIMPO|nr:coiled-coil domain-containing protein 6-like [Limulus polyphemus]
MADSANESDSNSVDGGLMIPPVPLTREQFQKRNESLIQENRVLKIELDTFKLRVKSLQEGNRVLRQASVNIQAKAEQEEEYISNTLLKKIQSLKKEKETLALNYEQEEECLTNDLSRKLNQLRHEKVQLEQTLEQEQEVLVNKLMRKIEKLESETLSKQSNLEQLRREKVELENTLEQEQEALVNRLWKRMDKLEAEKRMLQEKLDQPVSAPASPRDINNGDTAANLTLYVQHLRNEVAKLKMQLLNAQQEYSEKMAQFAMDEKQVREENVRLQQKLQMEMERREALCRHLSESESSLEMDEERHFNELSHGQGVHQTTIPSPIPYISSPNTSRPLSPGYGYGNTVNRDMINPSSPMGYCPHCCQPLYHIVAHSTHLPSTSPPLVSMFSHHARIPVVPAKAHTNSSQEKFIKPAPPTNYPCHPVVISQPGLTSGDKS